MSPRRCRQCNLICALRNSAWCRACWQRWWNYTVIHGGVPLERGNGTVDLPG